MTETDTDSKPEFFELAMAHVKALGIYGCNVAILCFCITLSVAVGVSLGNGIPLARESSNAFKAGVVFGRSDCPCNKKSPAVSQAGPSPLPVVQAVNHDKGETTVISSRRGLRDPGEVFTK